MLVEVYQLRYIVGAYWIYWHMVYGSWLRHIMSGMDI
jgi:hypothetical protein